MVTSDAIYIDPVGCVGGLAIIIIIVLIFAGGISSKPASNEADQQWMLLDYSEASWGSRNLLQAHYSKIPAGVLLMGPQNAPTHYYDTQKREWIPLEKG